MFLEDFGVTDIQEDRSNLNACTIVVTDESDGYQSFRAVEVSTAHNSRPRYTVTSLYFYPKY